MIRRIVLSLLGVLFIAFLALFLLASNTRGSMWLLQTFSAHRVTAEKAEGRLLDRLVLNNLRYENKNTEVRVKKLDLQWHAFALLRGAIAIQHLYMDELKITTTKKVTSSHRESSLHFPFDLELGDIQIHSGNNVLSLHGNLNHVWNVQWQIHIPELHSLLENASGRCESQGSLSGEREFPHLSGELQATHIRIGAHQLENLTGKLNLDLQPKGKIDFQLNGSHLRLENQVVKQFQLQGSGITNDHRITLNASLARAHVQAVLLGGFSDDEWQGALSQLDFLSSDWGQWHLQKNARLHIAPDSLQLSEFCWQSQKQSLCGEIQISPKALSGNLSLKIKELRFVKQLFPQIKNPEGEIDAHLKLAGSVQSPLITGTAQLLNGQTDIPSLGIRLSRVHAEGKSDAAGRLVFSGSAHSDKSILKFNGTTLLTSKDMPTTINMEGQRVLIAHTPEYTVYASPRVRMQWLNQQLSFTGNIDLPEAHLLLKNTNKSSTELSDDIVFADHPTAVTDKKTPIDYDLMLKLGSEIDFKAYNVIGKLAGKVHVLSRSNSIPTGTGEITVSGKYLAYGQNLDIREGRFIFTGNALNNPSLNIQAVKSMQLMAQPTDPNNTLSNAAAQIMQGDSVTLGVRVQGTLRHRKVSLFAEPAILSQSDILSYLLLGRPAAEASTADTQLLLKAASTLNGGGKVSFNQITQQIQKTMGLDELNVGSITQYHPTVNTYSQNTSLILAKWLSPRLYVNYSVGLLQPVNVLKLRYYFANNKQWYIQTETSRLANGLDFFYTIDRK